MGWVFTPGDFSGMKEYSRAVGVALGRLTKQGVIRQLARGLYDYPKDHPQLGRLTPPPDSIARALAGNGRTRLQPTGAYAAASVRAGAGQRGLSHRRPSRLVKVGNMELRFRNTTPRHLAAADRTSGTVIQAHCVISGRNK